MKKVLILLSILIFFTVIGLMAQDSTNLRIYEIVKNDIQKLADKLEGPAAHVYQTYVRQVKIEAITNILTASILLLLTGVIFGVSYKKADCEQPDFKGVVVYASGTVFCITLIVTICTISLLITGIINPEYQAIEKLLNDIK